MDVRDFADSQKTHYTVVPSVKRRKLDSYDTNNVPFVRLFDGEEPESMVLQRWELYHQLYYEFHSQVDDILHEIQRDVYGSIPRAIAKGLSQCDGKYFSLFLLGADGSTQVEAPEDDNKQLNVVVDLTPKESPNLRMILRRSMFKLHSTLDTKLHGNQDEADDEEPSDVEESDQLQGGSTTPFIEAEEELDGVLYDLSMIERLSKKFQKRLNIIFNFKDVDSFYFQVLEDFVWLLQSTLENEQVKICFVFNINTNISNFEKNLKQNCVRLLKKNFTKLDLSHNKGHKYVNSVFRSFLNTVDGKLNLSPRFVKFILDKMNNKSNQNLPLLIKILDYSLMAYFFQNPYSMFIDLTNINHFDEKYIQGLVKCNTFMSFIEIMINEQAPSDDILSLLENRGKALEEFFAEFLVRENPINGHLNYVVDFLEQNLGVTDFNVIELYHHMLLGTLDEFLKAWPECNEHMAQLSFEPMEIVFQELFTLDNNNGLLTQALFPFLRSNMEDNLLNCERIFPAPTRLHTEENTLEMELNTLLDPPICRLFKLYREANAVINVYDFFTAFKETLPSKEILELLRKAIEQDQLRLQPGQRDTLLQFISGSNDSEIFDKLALVWFVQSVSECQYIGIFRTHQYKSYEAIEKIIWRGI
ncbi:AaceriAAL169Cp [[Ashbya] aceris (nom. inval.)]|nr:AaceriAAL169Cp [[Ashbya] aceris (nom. inval.)]